MTAENKEGDKKVSRRTFIGGVAAGVVVAGVAAGVGGYLGGLSQAKPASATTVTTTAAAATVTMTSPPVTVTSTAPAVTSGSQQIILGSDTQLTGPEAALGTQSFQMEKYEINKVNAEGGFYIKDVGYPMQLNFICLDDGSDVSKAVSNMNQLYTQDHANFFVGTGGSVTSAQIEVAIEDNMVYVGGANDTAAEWAAGGTKTFAVFEQVQATGAAYPGPTVITPLYNWVDAQNAAGLAAPKTMAVWEEDSTEGSGMCGPNGDVVTLAPQHGIDVVFQQKYEAGGTDYTSLIEATKATNPDIVVGIPEPPDYVTMFKQSSQLNFTPKMWFMHKGPSAQQANEALGPLAAGIIQPVIWAPGSPYGQDAAAAFIAVNHYTPGWPALAFAASTETLLQAIQRTQSLDPTTVANTLHSDTFYTTIGTVKYNPDGSFYPLPFLSQLTYSTATNSLGEHVGYGTGPPIVYPLTSGCCTSSTAPVTAGAAYASLYASSSSSTTS